MFILYFLNATNAETNPLITTIATHLQRSVHNNWKEVNYYEKILSGLSDDSLKKLNTLGTITPDTHGFYLEQFLTNSLQGAGYSHRPYTTEHKEFVVSGAFEFLGNFSDMRESDASRALQSIAFALNSIMEQYPENAEKKRAELFRVAKDWGKHCTISGQAGVLCTITNLNILGEPQLFQDIYTAVSGLESLADKVRNYNDMDTLIGGLSSIPEDIRRECIENAIVNLRASDRTNLVAEDLLNVAHHEMLKIHKAKGVVDLFEEADLPFDY